METLIISITSIAILIAYTLDYGWAINKLFDLIGGCNE